MMDENNTINDNLANIMASFEKRTQQISDEQREARERFVVALSELSRQYDLLREWSEKTNIELKDFLKQLSSPQDSSELHEALNSMKEMTSSVAQQNADFSITISNELRQLVDAIKEQKVAEELLPEMKSISDKIENVNQNISETGRSAQTEIKNLLEELEKQRESVELPQLSKAIQETMEDINENNKTTKSRLESVDNNIKDLVKELIDLRSNSIEVKNVITSFSTTVNESLIKLINETEQTNKGMSFKQDEISEKIINKIEDIAMTFTSTISEFQTSILGILEHLEKSQSDIIEKQITSIVDLQKEIQTIYEVNSSTNSHIQKTNDILDVLSKKQDVISAVIDKRGEGLEEKLSLFNDSMSKSFEKINDQNDEFKNSMTDLLSNIGTQLTALEGSIQGADNSRKAEFEKLIEKITLIPDQLSTYLESNKEIQNAIKNTESSIGSISKSIEDFTKSVVEHEKMREEREIIERAQNHLSRGVILFYRNSFGAAEKEIRKAIELKPNFAEGYLNLGMVLGEIGNTEDAIQNIKKALQIEPGLEEAYNNLGVIQLRGEKYEEAIESFNEAIKMGFKYPLLYINMGKALIGLDRINDAVDTLKKALEIDPTNSEANELLSKYHKGS